jgi:AbiTii
MSDLLDDIIRLAEDGKQPIADILRKCLRLGHELKNEHLKVWATQELNGYDTGRDVPEYRKMPAEAYGNFVGPFHAQYHSHIIPPAVMLPENREFAEQVYLTGAVSAYSAAAHDEEGTAVLSFPWPANMIGYYSDKLLKGGFICHSAWQQIPTSAVVGMLDTIRNLTLKMALEIKDELGTSYTDLHNVKPHEKERIQSIVINAVGGNVAVGNIDASGSTTIIAGDRQSLDEALTKVGMDKDDLNELGKAILVDGGSKPGHKVSEWIQSKAGKVVTGGIKVGISIGQQLLTEFLLQHYGLKK